MNVFYNLINGNIIRMTGGGKSGELGFRLDLLTELSAIFERQTNQTNPKWGIEITLKDLVRLPFVQSVKMALRLI